MNALVWITYYTAVDFRARLRFPREAGEPPRCLRSCGVSPVPLFPHESLPCPPINSSKQIYIYEIYIHHTHEKIRTMNRDSPSRISIHRSDLPLTKILLSQSLFLLICLLLMFALPVNKLFIICRIGMFIVNSVKNMFI